RGDPPLVQTMGDGRETVCRFRVHSSAVARPSGLPMSAATSFISVVQHQTLRQAISYSGVGLHSGNRVTMTFLPATPNSGIRFRRIDLEGKPEVDEHNDNV